MEPSRINLSSRLLDPSCPPFALLRRRTPGRDHDTVEVLIGQVREVERLADLPVGEQPALALVPFRQIRERGFDVRDDGTPLSVLVAEEAHEVPLAEALAGLPQHPVRVDGGGFDVPDEEYAATVRRVIEDEIGRGEGANFVIRRTYEGRIGGFGPADALALFRRLLEGERGTYWTYVVHTGERTLVGASPEVHVRMSGGTVVMNPISGTYRYPAGGPTAQSLLAFLGDRKETEELSMVVDEELKMMCTVGDRGGVVVGPRLKEMSHLAHTEYELRGRSSMDVREVLRETMFAATVTGSPVQNACRVIERYEAGGRGYYAGALALLGVDPAGAQTLDSPILIRTADIAADGVLRVAVGATLVRHSDPDGEVAETHAKAAGVLAALGVRPAAPRPAFEGARLADDPRVRAALAARRSDLAPFWLRMQEQPAPVTGHALVVDGEDTFTAMLAHLLRVAGLAVTVRRYDDPGCGRRPWPGRARSCWARARATRPTRRTPGCGCCARSRPTCWPGTATAWSGSAWATSCWRRSSGCRWSARRSRRRGRRCGSACSGPRRWSASTTRTRRTATGRAPSGWRPPGWRWPATRPRARSTRSAPRAAASRGSSSTRSRCSPCAARTCCASC